MHSKTTHQRDFALLFCVMLVTAAGNTGLQSVLPALGRSLNVPDTVVAGVFSLTALVWSYFASFWAQRSDRYGRRRMVLLGMIGFVISLGATGVILTAGMLGLMTPLLVFAVLIVARMIYGAFGSAAPPAAQALVAVRSSRAERTKALTLLASAFGLGTILGPALAPFFVQPPLGLAGPAYFFAAVGLVVAIVAFRMLADDGPGVHARGAAASEPSIGGEPSGASVIAALNEQSSAPLKLRDPRLMPWMVVLIAGHAQAIAGQALGFLVIDRLLLEPLSAQPIIGLVLMSGAGAALLAQWGLIPRLRMEPGQMLLWGSLIAATGCAALALAEGLHAMVVAFAVASLGFGILRPAFTAGASLAVGTREQGAVAGRVTSVNGIVFVLGPLIGISLYEIAPQLPYLLAAAALVLSAAYSFKRLPPSSRAG
jgi:MFS family permease